MSGPGPAGDDGDDITPPGDDVVPVPRPVTEEPPQDRFCDLVLTGGVASGVVYPWAIVELARSFRFRNIGGTSVGAMAAALAAAAEYGRRVGFEAPFEALRRAPADLGRIMPGKEKKTRMLSLFHPNPHGWRLIWFWGKFWNGNEGQSEAQSRAPRPGESRRAMLLMLRAYWPWLAAGGIVGFVVAAVLLDVALSGTCVFNPCWLYRAARVVIVVVFVALVTLLCSGMAALWAVWCDFRKGVMANCYGLCKGSAWKRGEESDQRMGLSDWLHKGIQASAGLKLDDPPLTFADLWTAPAYPGGPRVHCTVDDPESQRSINLQMITTNVTHGRPYRLPLPDPTSRLFFLRKELDGYLPPAVLEHMARHAVPYAPERGEDPPADRIDQPFLQLPAAQLPVVLAARLSLSFPLLFSAVPLWAIDYEAPRELRKLRRCIFTDGGVSSNFPIHLFDASVPRWPTFGLWLGNRMPFPNLAEDERTGKLEEQVVCLPRYNGQGWADGWNRFDPESKPDDSGAPWKTNFRDFQPKGSSRKAKDPLGRFAGFLIGTMLSGKDWRDRTSFAMPHVRNRVARMLLLPNEGGLNIGMPREQILQMAARYGTPAGRKFVAAFRDHHGQPARAWAEQRWVRFNLLLNGLREQLTGLATRAAWSAGTTPLRDAIRQAAQVGPVEDRDNGHLISPAQVQELTRQLDELERLEVELRAASPAFASLPIPELRLRPPF